MVSSAGAARPTAGFALSGTLLVASPSSDAARNLLFAFLAAELPHGFGASVPGGWPSGAARDVVFAAVSAEWPPSQAGALSARNFSTRSSSPMYAAQPPRLSDDPLFDVPLFPEPGQDGWGDVNTADGSGARWTQSVITSQPIQSCWTIKRCPPSARVSKPLRGQGAAAKLARTLGSHALNHF